MSDENVIYYIVTFCDKYYDIGGLFLPYYYQILPNCQNKFKLNFHKKIEIRNKIFTTSAENCHQIVTTGEKLSLPFSIFNTPISLTIFNGWLPRAFFRFSHVSPNPRVNFGTSTDRHSPFRDKSCKQMPFSRFNEMSLCFFLQKTNSIKQAISALFNRSCQPLILPVFVTICSANVNILNMTIFTSAEIIALSDTKRLYDILPQTWERHFTRDELSRSICGEHNFCPKKDNCHTKKVRNQLFQTDCPDMANRDIQDLATLVLSDIQDYERRQYCQQMNYLQKTFTAILRSLNCIMNICKKFLAMQPTFTFQHNCCAVNVWKILHESNYTLLATSTVYRVQQQSSSPEPGNPSYFLPFLNESPILMVNLYAHQLLAMLDSGCSKNLCSSTAIQKICPHYETLIQKYQAPFSDVQGKLLSTKGILPNTQIKIDDHKFVIDIIIFDSPDLTFLLGFEFVKQFDLQISAKGLILPQNVCRQVHQSAPPLSPLKIAARVHESTFIEAAASKIIDVNLDLQQVKIPFTQLRLKHLVASSEELQPDMPFHKLSIFFQYINVPVNGKISLQYCNFDHCSITLHAGDIVAYVEEMSYPLPHLDRNNHVFQTTIPPYCSTTADSATAAAAAAKHNQSIIDHPVFNQVYAVCRHLSQIEQLTEADIQERLSQMQYHAHKTNPPITDQDINVQSNNPAHIQFAKNLVYSHAKLFTAHSLDVGTFRGPPVNLQLKEGVEPVALPQYPISPKLLPAARRLVSRFLQMGVLGHSTSPWNCPVFVLSKKKGEKQNPGDNDVALEQQSTTAGSIKSTDLRLILDSRQINSNLVRNYQDFPIPRTIDIIHNLYGAKYVGIFDVSNAFFSHQLTRSTAQYFAWTFENLKIEFRRLPQGCLASPTIFCSYITRLVTSAGLTRFASWPDGSYDGVQVYFDNITVSAKTEENYKRMLTILFDVLLDSGYRLKLSKAFFFITQKLYNIYILHFNSCQSISPLATKVTWR